MSRNEFLSDCTNYGSNQEERYTLQIQFGKCIELDLIILDFVRTCVFVLLFLLAKSNMPIALCRCSIICYLTLSFSGAGKFELMHCLMAYIWARVPFQLSHIVGFCCWFCSFYLFNLS